MLGVLREPILYLSLFFKTHRATYYDLLDRTRREGDWEAWLDFFAQGVAETASGAVETTHRLAERVRVGGLIARAEPNPEPKP